MGEFLRSAFFFEKGFFRHSVIINYHFSRFYFQSTSFQFDLIRNGLGDKSIFITPPPALAKALTVTNKGIDEMVNLVLKKTFLLYVTLHGATCLL